MKKPLYYKTVTLWFVLLMAAAAPAMGEENIRLETSSGTLHGTLALPEGSQSCPIALIIAGSGPTDRNGNNPITGQNNSLKFLADQLALNGTGSLRYDKRGIAESKAAAQKQENLRFETYIDDAVAWCEELRKHPRMASLIIIGHSEGSLVGTAVSQKVSPAAFISIAGTAFPASKTLSEQLKSIISPDFYQESRDILAKLSEGRTTDNISPELEMIFRPSVQPYLISWFKYDPIKELADVKAPILILHGATDAQVPPSHAQLLGKAAPSAQVFIIAGMNHVLKEVSGPLQKQLPAYGDPTLPLAPGLVEKIVSFIKALKK